MIVQTPSYESLEESYQQAMQTLTDEQEYHDMVQLQLARAVVILADLNRDDYDLENVIQHSRKIVEDAKPLNPEEGKNETKL